MTVNFDKVKLLLSKLTKSVPSRTFDNLNGTSNQLWEVPWERTKDLCERRVALSWENWWHLTQVTSNGDLVTVGKVVAEVTSSTVVCEPLVGKLVGILPLQNDRRRFCGEFGGSHVRSVSYTSGTPPKAHVKSLVRNVTWTLCGPLVASLRNRRRFCGQLGGSCVLHTLGASGGKVGGKTASPNDRRDASVGSLVGAVTEASTILQRRSHGKFGEKCDLDAMWALGSVSEE